LQQDIHKKYGLKNLRWRWGSDIRREPIISRLLRMGLCGGGETVRSMTTEVG
jgi:hypothetical protein